VDLNTPGISVKFPYLASSRALTSTMITSQYPAATGGINGTYFDTSTGGGGHETYLRVNNVVIPQVTPSKGAWSWNGGIAITPGGAVSVIPMPAGGWATNTTHQDIMANGPQLIITNVIPSATFTTIGSHCTSRNPRTAAGVTADNRLILLTADGRTDQADGMTCDEIALTMQQLGCIDALNLDGGGSSTLWGRGEPFNGVINYPSDNGIYDHSGERSGSNAVAVIALTTGSLEYDARVTGVSYSGTMTVGNTQTATITYQNIGTQPWTSSNVKLVTSRPTSRVSDFYTTGSWVTTSNPANLSPATVNPGQSGSFSFVITAPSASTTVVREEYFMLSRVGSGRFGPADNEARLKIVVNPPSTGGGASFLVESRTGGQNVPWYTDSGMADSGTNCTAPGASGTVGTRYGSTYRSVAGSKSATWTPVFPATGQYNVYVAWGAGSSRRNPITYHVNHAGGQTTFQVDQSSTENIWIQLGSGPFTFNAGSSGDVRMTNENIDVSGNMFAGPVKFEFVPAAVVDEWCLY
jgi:hypothetical protein